MLKDKHSIVWVDVVFVFEVNYSVGVHTKEALNIGPFPVN